MAVAVMVQEGDQIDYTPGADVAAGDVIDLGTYVGVALVDIKSGEQKALNINGVFDVAKKAGDAPAICTKMFWDATNKYVTVTGPADAVFGYTVKAAGGSDATARVKILWGV